MVTYLYLVHVNVLMIELTMQLAAAKPTTVRPTIWYFEKYIKTIIRRGKSFRKNSSILSIPFLDLFCILYYKIDT